MYGAPARYEGSSSTTRRMSASTRALSATADQSSRFDRIQVAQAPAQANAAGTSSTSRVRTAASNSPYGAVQVLQIARCSRHSPRHP